MGRVHQQRHAQRDRHLNEHGAYRKFRAVNDGCAEAFVFGQQTLIIVQALVFQDDPAAFFRADETANALKTQEESRPCRVYGKHQKRQQRKGARKM